MKILNSRNFENALNSKYIKVYCFVYKIFSFLVRSANDEKLQLLEDNRIYIEKLKTELQLTKEQQERTLRDKMKSDLT